MKAAFVLPVALAIGLLSSGCCDETLDYSRIDSTGLYAMEHPDSAFIEDSFITVADTLFFQLHTHYSYVAANCNKLWLINAAHATSCEEGTAGLKDPIFTIAFYSDREFAGIEAGKSINAFVKAHFRQYVEQTYSEKFEGIGQAIIYMNRSPISPGFVILQPPGDAGLRRIKAVLVFESGRTVISESPLFSWQ